MSVLALVPQWQHFVGSWHVFKFYFDYLPWLHKLPTALKLPETVAEQCSKGQEFTVELDDAPAKEYNGAMLDLTKKLRGLHTHKSFPALMLAFFMLRLAVVYMAWKGDARSTILLSLLQFAIAPYSFAMAFMTLVALFPGIFVGYYVTYAPTRWLLHTWLLPLLPGGVTDYLQLPINNQFIAVFFALDFALCAMCTVWTPDGRSATPSPRRLLQSIAFGSINAKSYTLVLLLLSRGLSLDLGVWLLDWALGLTKRVNGFVSKYTLHWAPLFYHQHRLAHLPHVYADAHKFHHYLHDSNAFDAHLYGSGAPEEWHCMMLEALPALYCGIPPASLSPYVLYLDWTNKTGHSRTGHDREGVNRHADHHLFHRKNYGIFNALLDMYMGTNTNNTDYEVPGYAVHKSWREEGAKWVFTFTPTAAKAHKQ